MVFFFTGCLREEDCFDIGSTTKVDDLINLLPDQREYEQRHIVTLSLTLPASNSCFRNERNLFQKTGDNPALLVLGFNQLFLDNLLLQKV